ncbi:SMI1/KNR4 family protein [Fodinicola feengrottensis]|uniref:Knr4/Smi1-like domain-containing protein n=1 Tax=Fodinicola feengrottensis TaxID=435914 RepID=A0ABN2JD26_9ACTN|nr:SMI1/KNR4 family protein [Fodinicola feengrottensis]
MLSIAEIAAEVRAVDVDLVVGLDVREVDQLASSWQIGGLPKAYVEFLRLMGSGAGRILLGTDAFYPAILDLPRATHDFFADNVGGVKLPEGALVFAMHQGYQVYWMDSLNVADPSVTLYMEEEEAPMARWKSFTEFVNAEYLSAYSPDRKR